MKFGSIFEYADKKYVYLAETPEAIYAARILTIPETKIIEDTYNRLLAKNSPNIDKMSIYSYVILETEPLKDRAASFHRTDGTNFVDWLFNPLNIVLEKEDLIKIKDEITKDGCVSIKLKTLVSDIEI